MKIFAVIKDYLPKSLFGRSLLIVVIPILAVQSVVTYIFVDRLYGDVTIAKTTDLAREVNYVLEPSDTGEASAPSLAQLRSRAAPLQIRVNTQLPTGLRINEDRIGFIDISGRYLIATLRQEIDQIVGIDLLSQEDRILIDLRRAGQIWRINIRRDRATASNPHQLLVASTLAALLFLGLAIIFLKNQVKPITLLARSAEAFGKGRKIPFAPRGAAEVRRAGHAFISMQSRIERQIDQRTQMLSGVSHDLRTPLTRMKLSLSMLGDDPQIQELQGDVVEMEHIMEEFLAFARGDSGEDTVAVNVKPFIKSLIRDRKRLGHEVDLHFAQGDQESPEIMAKHQSLRRAINNLLANAQRYAQACRATVSIDSDGVRFVVEDDGPGIPKASREDALQPFERLDAARNQNQGTGTGLGLAIVADVARSHGGQLTLGHSDALGGLRAQLFIPR
ncbi:two-component sensor histidine kinase [Amylibacter marinus]|uniref:histidine kinase n=1 Tax=Amylibacter marinus TaxID=1475483 RepID=A0ABQ5VSA4_9RHOB|nr:ATP-binding protein [Amylibacter marinus]GLQ34166.1 two-component sensor histidine kinase [Amylibacter marinus]